MAKGQCGAKTRAGTPCKRAPVPGKKRCKLHGGASLVGPDSGTYVHGRYAKVFRGQLAAKFADQVDADNPLDLLPELAVQRTLLATYIEHIGNKKRPSVLALGNISALANDVVKTATAIIKSRNETALTAAEVTFILTGIRNLLEKYVPDPDARRSFIAELRGLVPGRTDDEAPEPADIPALAGTSSDAA
jgi:hypothetical protein